MPTRVIIWIFKDLLWITFLATLSLVALLTLGAALRPLLGDLPLTAIDLLNIIGLGSIPMMQFALPIAVGFSSTVLYQRLSEDHEITALLAVGIPYSVIISPVILLTVILAAGQSFILHEIAPKVSSRIAEILSEDGLRWMKTTLAQGKSFTIGDLVVRADSVNEKPRSDFNNVDRLELRGVMATGGVFGEIGKGEIVASRAIVDLHKDTDAIHLSFENPIVWRGGNDGGEIDGASYLSLTHAIQFGESSAARTRSISRTDMDMYIFNPSNWPAVQKKMQHSIQAIERRLMSNWIRKNLKESGVIHLEQRGLEGRKYQLSAKNLLRNNEFSSEIEIVQIEKGTPVRRYVCEKANIVWPDLNINTISIVLHDVKLYSLGQSIPPNFRKLLELKNLYGENNFLGSLAQSTIEEISIKSSEVNIPSVGDKLHSEVLKMQRHFHSRSLERWALSLAVVPSGLLGAVLALWLTRLRSASPLSIYLVAFLPSITNLLLITSAEKVLRDGFGAQGMFLLISGTLLSLSFAIYIFWNKVSRN